MDQTTSQTRDTPRPGALFCLALSMLLAALGTSIVNIALPVLARAFGASFAQVQWLVIAYLGALTLFSVIAGRLADRFGRRYMLCLGLGLFVVASGFCASISGLWLLIAGRVVQGVGAAFMMTLTIALVREIAGARIGRAMGLLGTMSALGTALGPSLGGVVLEHFAWPVMFWLLVPPALLATILAVVFLPPDARISDRAYFPGLVQDAWPLWPCLLANLLVANVMMATLLVGPFYLGPGLGLRPALVGMVMSVGPVLSIVSGVPSGRLVDAWGAGRVGQFGLIALAFGAFGLCLLPALFGLAGYIAAIVVLTPGYQLFQSANNTMVMARSPEALRGTLSGLLGLSRNLGLILGASAMGAVFALGLGGLSVEAAPPEAILRGLQATFCCGGLLLLGALGLTRLQA